MDTIKCYTEKLETGLQREKLSQPLEILAASWNRAFILKLEMRASQPTLNNGAKPEIVAQLDPVAAPQKTFGLSVDPKINYKNAPKVATL
jgi:hypothetical protein